jgi:ubiquinone/menaquinone biosynthesis C-methylase UbiE
LNQEAVDLLCCPACNGELTQRINKNPVDDSPPGFYCVKCDLDYPEKDGYVNFLGNIIMDYSSRREKIVRSVYAKYYTKLNNFLFLFCGGAENARKEVLDQLDLKDNQSVLETGMGAGENYLRMNRQAKNLRFYGIDIQEQMMHHCIKNTKEWGINVNLFRSDAALLPFKDNKFDVVFHLGAINLFPDKGKAIMEMIRVARPGTTLVIADETDKASKYFNFFTGANEKTIPPMGLIPGDMLNITMKIIWRGFGYVIRFKKP